MQKTPPSRNTIIHWHNMFIENRNLGHREGDERPRTCEVTVEEVRLIFENKPWLSVRPASSTLQVSHTTVHRILRRCLFCTHKKCKISMALAAANNVKRLKFARHCQNHPSGYSEYLSKTVLSDERTFLLNS